MFSVGSLAEDFQLRIFTLGSLALGYLASGSLALGSLAFGSSCGMRGTTHSKSRGEKLWLQSTCNPRSFLGRGLWQLTTRSTTASASFYHCSRRSTLDHVSHHELTSSHKNLKWTCTNVLQRITSTLQAAVL